MAKAARLWVSKAVPDKARVNALSLRTWRRPGHQIKTTKDREGSPHWDVKAGTRSRLKETLRTPTAF